MFIEVVAEFVNLMLGFESPKLDFYSSSYGPSHSQNCHNLSCLFVCVQILGLNLVLQWD